MLKNLSIRTKLILLVAIPVIASMIITTIGIYYVNQISRDLTKSLYEEGFQSSAQVLNADRDMYQALENMNLMIAENLEGTLTITRKSEYLAGFQENAKQTSDRAKTAIEILSEQEDFWGSIQDDAGLTLFNHYEEFQTHFQRWEESNGQVADTYVTSDEWSSYFEESRNHLNVIGELVEKGVNQSIMANETSKKAMILMILAINTVAEIGRAHV